jgi:L-lactate dehydrogenase (cytochrome)
MEIYVDGGIRRGTDVLKALSLGARAVGLGRPFLYAQSAYGAEGVVRAHESGYLLVVACEVVIMSTDRFPLLAVLKEEITTGMRLMGVTSLSELKPEMVDCLPP